MDIYIPLKFMKGEGPGLKSVLKYAAVSKITGHIFNNIFNKIFHSSLGSHFNLSVA
jgi:hypothetical protein